MPGKEKGARAIHVGRPSRRRRPGPAARSGPHRPPSPKVAVARFERRVRVLERHPTFDNAQQACLSSRAAWWAEFNHILLTGKPDVARLRRLAELMRECQYGVQLAATRVQNRHAQLLIHYVDAISFRRDMLDLLMKAGMDEVVEAMLREMDRNTLTTFRDTLGEYPPAARGANVVG